MRPHERFDAWKFCFQLTLRVYAESRDWPRNEMFGLTSQVRRSAVSAVANIVEGAAKRGRREFRRYLDISSGSLAELGCLLDLARELGYTTEARWRSVSTEWEKAARTTMALNRAMSENTKGRLDRKG